MREVSSEKLVHTIVHHLLLNGLVDRHLVVVIFWSICRIIVDITVDAVVAGFGNSELLVFQRLYE